METCLWLYFYYRNYGSLMISETFDYKHFWMSLKNFKKSAMIITHEFVKYGITFEFYSINFSTRKIILRNI